MTKFLNNADIKGYIAQTAVTSYLLKADSTGRLVAAIAGTDYQAPTTALLPSGGTAGQILAKIDGTNYNTQWIDNFAQQIKYDVKLGAALSKGTPVYVSSANGTNIIVSASSNTTEATSSKTLGLLETGGALNDIVKVVSDGLLSGLNTSAATIGDPVWLGVNGALIFGLANKPSAPAHLVYIGAVTRVHATNGEIFIKVQNGFELDELHNVSARTPSNNDVLYYNTSTSLWQTASMPTVLGYTPEQSLTFSSPLVRTVNTISIPAATASVNGYLSSADWTTFNSKQAALSGTGFVKINGTTISYDNSTYLTTSAAASTYVPYTGATGNVNLGFRELQAGYLYANGTSTDGGALNIKKYATVSVAGSGYFSLTAGDGVARLYDNIGGISKTANLSFALIADYASRTYTFPNASGTFALTSDLSSYLPLSGGTLTGNIVLGSGTIGSIPSWMKVITTDATQSGLGAVYNNKAIYLYNNGSAIKLDAYDYGTSTGLNIQIGGNGGKIIASNGQVQFTAYTTSTSFSGTAAGYLAFDSSGNVITVGSVAATDNTKLPLAGGTMTGGLVQQAAINAWGTTTQGGTVGGIHLGAASAAANAGPAITFGARDASAGGNAQAGIYINSDGNYGTRMYLATTDSYAAGSKTAVSISETGVVNFVRANATVQGNGILHAGNYSSYALPLTGGTVSGQIVSTGKIRMQSDLGFDAGYTLYFGKEEGFGGSDTGGADWGYITYDNNSTKYGSGGGETSVLRMGSSNDGPGAYSDSIAIEPTADLYLNPGGTIYRGTYATKYTVWDSGNLTNLNQLSNGPGYITSSSTVAGLNTEFLGTGSTNISSGYSRVIRNENGSGGNPNYAPVLHLAASDTMWQIAGAHGGSTTLVWRSGYAGNWTTPWWNILHSGNVSSYALPISGGTLTGTTTVNGGSSFVASGYNNSGGYAMNNASTYWGLMWNYSSNDWRLGYGSQTAQVGWNLRWDASGNAWANTSMRAPIFYDSDDTTYYLDPAGNGTRAGYFNGNIWINPKPESYGEGVTFYMPNQNTWGGLRWYRNGPGGGYSGNWAFGYFGNEANNDIGFHNGTNGWRLDQSFNMTSIGSVRSPIFYDSNDTTYYMDFNSTTSGVLRGNLIFNDYGAGIVGSYSSYRYQAVFSMGNAYKLPIDGSSTGNLYGMAWSHPNAGGIAGNLNTHGLLVMENGTFLAAISGNIKARDGIIAGSYMYAPSYLETNGPVYATIMYDNNDRSYYVDPNSMSQMSGIMSNNWFRPQGDTGLYSQDYGGYFRRNTNSYGTWESTGYAKNGWGGYVNNNNYIVSWMLNTSGDFGFLTQNGNWWNLFYNNGNNCWGIGTDNTYSGDGFRCIKYGSSQYGWTTWSDRRAKENISNITGALDKVLNMRGVYFNYISDEAKNKRVGFIAQELEGVLPEAVRYAEEIDEYNVEYAQIVSVLAEAIKEQNAKIQTLEDQLQTLLN